MSANRLNFLLESLRDLDSSLRARKSRLIILRGKPKDVLPKIFKAWNVGQLCYEYVRAWSRESSACVGAVTSFVPTSCRQDTEPYAVARDQEMSAMACGLGIDVHACHGHTLFDPYKVAAKCGGKCSCRSLELFLISITLLLSLPRLRNPLCGLAQVNRRSRTSLF